MTDLPLIDERTGAACRLPLLWPINQRGVVFVRFPLPGPSEAARILTNTLAWGLMTQGAKPLPWRFDN